MKLFTGSDKVRVWNVDGSEVSRHSELSLGQVYKSYDSVEGMCLSHDNSFAAALLSAANEKKVMLFGFGRQVHKEVTLLDGSVGLVRNLALSANFRQISSIALDGKSKLLAAGEKSGRIRFISLSSNRITSEFTDLSQDVRCLAFDANDRYIASGDSTGGIHIHNIMRNQKVSSLVESKRQSLNSLKYSGLVKTLLASAGDGEIVSLWDIHKETLLKDLQGHKSPVTDVYFSPCNDKLLCSTGLDRKILFYDVEKKARIQSISISSEDQFRCVSLNEDGFSLAVGTVKGTTYLYDLRSLKTHISKIGDEGPRAVSAVQWEYGKSRADDDDSLPSLLREEDIKAPKTSFPSAIPGTRDLGTGGVFSPVKTNVRKKAGNKESSILGSSLALTSEPSMESSAASKYSGIMGGKWNQFTIGDYRSNRPFKPKLDFNVPTVDEKITDTLNEDMEVGELDVNLEEKTDSSEEKEEREPTIRIQGEENTEISSSITNVGVVTDTKELEKDKEELKERTSDLELTREGNIQLPKRFHVEEAKDYDIRSFIQNSIEEAAEQMQHQIFNVHLDMLKNFEQVKYELSENRKHISELRKENEDLKAQLISNKEDPFQ